MLSAPVKLEVGRLYRLSADVETRGVAVDPVGRYPTPVGACIAMKSFPFTNCSPSLAGDARRRVELLFFATTASDRVALHLGRNGKATGSATFSDVRLEEVPDVTAYVPLAQVKWSGPGFRYDDGGWIFVHVEGEPYPRGRQYGELVAPELARYLEKLAIAPGQGRPGEGLERAAAPRRRAHDAPLRPRVPGGDEGDRRRRRQGRARSSRGARSTCSTW